MVCKECGEIPRSAPAGSITSLVKGIVAPVVKTVKTYVRPAIGATDSPIVRLGGSTTIPKVTTSAADDVFAAGVRHGESSVIPNVVRPTRDVDVLLRQAQDALSASRKQAELRIQATIRAPSPTISPQVSSSPDAALRAFQQRISPMVEGPVLVTPEAIGRSSTLLRAPEAAAVHRGTVEAARKVADDISLALSTEGRAMSRQEMQLLSGAMREVDDATTTFLRQPEVRPEVLAQQVRAQLDTAIRDTPVTEMLRSTARTSDDVVEQVLKKTDYDSLRVLPGESVQVERMVIDETGRPLMQKVIGSADGGTSSVYRELTGSETRIFSQRLAREATGEADSALRYAADDFARMDSRGIVGSADDLARIETRQGIMTVADNAAGKASSIYRTGALLAGAGVTGGVLATVLFSPADAIPIGTDLAAYQEAVCDPESPYYDEASCATITQVNDLIKAYPTSWNEVCIEGSPIYDPEMCQVIQGMAAAAQAGVPYQGGRAEDYGGTTEMVTQDTIDQYVALYCHPASQSYSAQACAQVKALADKYGLVVNVPGEDVPSEEQPPWSELTAEEIHAIVCDRYGQWYDAALCAEYTEYLWQQYGGGSSGSSGGSSSSGYYDPVYVVGDDVYPDVGGVTDGGWYGGGGGGVEYYLTEDGTIPICAIDDPVCIGWFQYGTEWFYWDGQEFYDAYGNLIYFVWTEEDQAYYESLLAQVEPVGSVVEESY